MVIKFIEFEKQLTNDEYFKLNELFEDNIRLARLGYDVILITNKGYYLNTEAYNVRLVEQILANSLEAVNGG